MRGHARVDRIFLEHCAAAENEYHPAPAPLQPVDIEALRVYHENVALVRERIEAMPLGLQHHAWKLRTMGSIAAEIEVETGRMLRRAGVVR